MKHSKKPTRRQKMLLCRYRLDPDNWLIIKDCSECFEIVNKVSGKSRRINRKVEL